MARYVARSARTFSRVSDNNSIPKALIRDSTPHVFSRGPDGNVTAFGLSEYIGSHTILVSGWVRSGSQYRYTIQDDGIHKNDVVTLYSAEEGGTAQIQANMMGLTCGDTYDGSMVLYANTKPTADFEVGYTAVRLLNASDALPFTYTGDFKVTESANPTTGERRVYVRFLTSGTLKTLRSLTVDLYAAGGGGGAGDMQTSGAGGGYTANSFNVTLAANTTIQITIGQGGAKLSRGGTTSIGSLLSAEGGYPGKSGYGSGGNGGSGGGGASGNSVGGSNGSDGVKGDTAHNPAGNGQGFTTRPFMGDVEPFKSQATMQLCPGGNGAGATGTGQPGSYGAVRSGAGTANTGAGGGSGKLSSNHNGGSGVAMMRYGDWAA